MKSRLQLIIEWIEAESKWTKIADIGTDHGFVPLCLAEKSSRLTIFATDIVQLPINKLKEKSGHMPQIKTFVGFGLNPLQGQELDLCIIAGMGVQKTLKILKLDSHLQKNYLFQGIENPIKLREWVQQKHYFIVKEKIIKEKNYYYHTLLISKSKGIHITNKEENYFGPLLLKEKDDVFLEYWQNIFHFKKNIVKEITNTDKSNKIKKEIKMIQNTLQNA